MPYDLRQGHCLDLIDKLATEIDVVITSPPYFGSDYETPLIPEWGRLGHETDVDAYVDHVCLILEAISKKLKSTGIVWLAVGDVPGQLSRLQGIPAKIGTASDKHRLSWVYTMHWIADSVFVPEGTVPFGPFTATVPILGLCLEPDYHYWLEGHKMTDWMAYPPPAPAKGLPFQPLPSTVVGDLLEATCPSGGAVLDPMCGSGTVPAVANVMGYLGLGFDVDERSIKAARRKCIRLKEVSHAEIAGRNQKLGGVLPLPTKEAEN